MPFVHWFPNRGPALLACIVQVVGVMYWMGLVQTTPAQGAEDGNPPSADGTGLKWAGEAGPLLQRFCADCHSGDDAEGEFKLDRYVEQSLVEEDRTFWQKVRHQIAFGAMPPEDATLPAKAERDLMVSAIDRVLLGTDGCEMRERPAPITARRLNRAEYNNTIRDLLGVDLRPADAFPSDDVGDGFDNNANVLTLPPLLLEKYLEAAESVANAAIITPEELKEREIHQELAGDAIKTEGPVTRDSFVRHQLAPGGLARATFQLPVAGKYRVTITLYKPDTSPFDKPLILRTTGGGTLQEFTFENPIQLRLKGDFEFAAGALNLECMLPEGAVATGEAPGEDDHRPPKEAVAVVNEIRVDGPMNWTDSMMPEHHQRIVLAKPRKGVDVTQAATQCLTPLLQRAFRGDVGTEEVDRYVALVKEATARGLPFERGLEVALSAVLVSPRFLYRIEIHPETVADSATPETLQLGGFEMANRLSYFLWSSMPDDRLLERARAGELVQDDVLRAEVDRMLADPRSEALFDNFAAQWLGLRNLSTASPDTERFPQFNDALKNAMQQETRMVFLELLRSRRSLLELIDGKATFVNQRLAEHYGLTGVQGEAFQRVSLDGTPRAGILSHASVLTLTSNPGRTSPVKRGKWVLENLLGMPPPEPPPGVQSLEESAKSVADLPLRNQLELHRADPACAACHRYMDAIGFGLENFDAVGRWRDLDQGKPIDAAGELPSGDAFGGPSDLAAKLRSAGADDFRKLFADRLLTYALGRGLTPPDRCAVTDLAAVSKAGDGSMAELITALVLHPVFRNYPLAPEESPR